MLKILHTSMRRLALKDVFRGLDGWKHGVELQKEQNRLFRVAARTAARFKGPQFLGMFDYWRREYALEGGAPMYTPGPFERCLGCFVK